MQPVDNDMDDLYRKAAEDYPLNTGSADWNKLLQKMEACNEFPPAEKGGKKARLLWLLLLLPMFFICNHYTSDNGFNFSTRQQAKTGDIGREQKANPEKQSINNINGDNITNSSRLQKDKSETNSLIVNNKENNIDNKTNQVKDFGQREASFNSIVSNKKQEKKFNNNKKIKGVQKDKGAEELVSGNEKISEDRQSEKDITNETSAVENEKSLDKGTGTPALKENKTTLATAPVEKVDNKNEDSVSSKVAKKSRPAQKNKLYWGIMGGPDFSMVKSGKVHGVGSSFGIIGGYKIGNKWSIETGVFWDKKDYESEGQYFKTGKTGWPQHTNVIDISGYCKMFEVPVNLRYNLSVNNKHSWFATAGISSYFMKNEDYEYTVERYGVHYYGEKEYKNSSSNWLSIMHMSLGYEKLIGAIGNVRIEPYVKLPVKGVGIGSLPLRSTGVYLGITRPIR